jgi:hypothetical protein
MRHSLRYVVFSSGVCASLCVCLAEEAKVLLVLYCEKDIKEAEEEVAKAGGVRRETR